MNIYIYINLYLTTHYVPFYVVCEKMFVNKTMLLRCNKNFNLTNYFFSLTSKGFDTDLRKPQKKFLNYWPGH